MSLRTRTAGEIVAACDFIGRDEASAIPVADTCLVGQTVRALPNIYVFTPLSNVIAFPVSRAMWERAL